MLVLALMVTAPIGARGQAILPGTTQPARAVPARAGVSRAASVEPRTMLRNVTVLRGRTSVEVHIETSSPVKPAVMALSQPERIVVDLAGVACGGGHHLSVGTTEVYGVRVALFQSDPPVTRVVVDLAAPHQYRLLPAGSTVILAIDTTPKPASTPAEAAVPRSPAPPAEVPSVVPAAGATAEAKAQPPVATTSNLPDSAVPVRHSGAPNSDGSGAVASTVPSSSAGGSGSPAAPARTASAPARLTEPIAPTVSSNIPQVGNPPLTVPANTSQSSGDEETTPHQAAKGEKPGVVRSITVFREKDAIAVLIEGNKPLRAAAATQSNPERIVIDLANVRLHRPRRIAVNAADVRTVSASLYLVNPLITRVVVDLTRPHAYHVDPYGNWLTVRIDTANRTAIEAAGPKAVR